MATNEASGGASDDGTLRAALERFTEARSELLRGATSVHNTSLAAIRKSWESAARDALIAVAERAGEGSPVAAAATVLRTALARALHPWAIRDVLVGATPPNRDALRVLAAAAAQQTTDAHSSSQAVTNEKPKKGDKAKRKHPTKPQERRDRILRENAALLRSDKKETAIVAELHAKGVKIDKRSLPRWRKRLAELDSASE